MIFLQEVGEKPIESGMSHKKVSILLRVGSKHEFILMKTQC